MILCIIFLETEKSMSGEVTAFDIWSAYNFFLIFGIQKKQDLIRWCSSLLSIYVIKTMTQSNLGKGDLFQFLLQATAHPLGKSSRSPEEHCLRPAPPARAHLSYSAQDHLPVGGTATVGQALSCCHWKATHTPVRLRPVSVATPSFGCVVLTERCTYR